MFFLCLLAFITLFQSSICCFMFSCFHGFFFNCLLAMFEVKNVVNFISWFYFSQLRFCIYLRFFCLTPECSIFYTKNFFLNSFIPQFSFRSIFLEISFFDIISYATCWRCNAALSTIFFIFEGIFAAYNWYFISIYFIGILLVHLQACEA